MPTYEYKCSVCGAERSVIQTIADYIIAPKKPLCAAHGGMERKLSVNPAFSGTANALAGDRHYDGLRATDGADISSRSKHRAYMRERGLTTTDDYKDTWARAQKEREALRKGTFEDRELRADLTEKVMKAVAQPD